MSERIHYHSWTLDRNFTFGEWCDYLKANPDGGCVYRFNGFEFNVHGYCFNPREIKLYHTPGDERVYARVRVYEVPERKNGGGWEYRCDINERLFGGSCGFGIEKTEIDAILAGLRKLRAKYDKEMDSYKGRTYTDEDGREHGYQDLISRLRSMRSLVDKEIEGRMQLSLFGF